jgi:hypothetical protein
MFSWTWLLDGSELSVSWCQLCFRARDTRTGMGAAQKRKISPGKSPRFARASLGWVIQPGPCHSNVAKIMGQLNRYLYIIKLIQKLCCNHLKLLNSPFLCSFTKDLWKATASFVMFVPPVSPHGMNDLALTGPTFVKFYLYIYISDTSSVSSCWLGNP